MDSSSFLGMQDERGQGVREKEGRKTERGLRSLRSCPSPPKCSSTSVGSGSSSVMHLCHSLGRIRVLGFGAMLHATFLGFMLRTYCFRGICCACHIYK